MRRALLFCLIFTAGALTGYGVSVGDSSVWAGGGASESCGDLNDDDTVDVSDAVHLLLHLFAGGPPPVCATADTPVSTVVLVRHAEKAGSGDAPLSAEGRLRAQHLAEVLGRADVGFLIASTLIRTQETLEPLATLTELPVETLMEATDVVDRLRALPPGSLAVVAHHSFTIHDILEGLGLGRREDIDVSGDNYDDLLVILRPPESGPQLVRLTY